MYDSCGAACRDLQISRLGFVPKYVAVNLLSIPRNSFDAPGKNEDGTESESSISAQEIGEIDIRI